MKIKRHLKTYHFITLCMTVFLLNGCASIRPPALSSNTKAVDVSKESIALLTVKIANNYKPNYQPEILYTFISTDSKKESKRFSIRAGKKHKAVENSYNEYLLSFQLPAGKYKLRELYAQSGIIPFIGTFSVPLYSSFSLKPGQVIYLGHVDATVKERTNDRLLRAGPVIPLIDQAVTGTSGGTFIVSIKDSYNKDINLFRQKYPYLVQQKIIDATLPQWRQPSQKDMQ